jgi:hypothetical protein
LERQHIRNFGYIVLGELLMTSIVQYNICLRRNMDGKQLEITKYAQILFMRFE